MEDEEKYIDALSKYIRNDIDETEKCGRVVVEENIFRIDDQTWKKFIKTKPTINAGEG
jgi:hypothetical protein